MASGHIGPTEVVVPQTQQKVHTQHHAVVLGGTLLCLSWKT